ncbi:MAG: hypothetical protein KC618_02165, partial [Candidatus Omnitrophica bacterium]|nr:hypothetical protein [Candidatus Omnitrophota bacterium]
MNFFKKVFVLAIVVLSAVQFRAEATKRYDVKSGYIKYDITGQTEGKEELYWTNYGEEEGRYTETSVNVFGIEQSNRTVNIINGQWANAVNPNNNTATKVNHEELMEKMAGKTPTDFSNAMIEAFGGEKTGVEKILGKKCDIYTLKNFGDMKVWVYKGLALKSEANIMGFEYRTQAVEFKENTNIEQTKVTLPSNVTVVQEMDAGDMPDAEEMGQVMQQLKEMKNSPEYQEAMDQFQELQNNPEFQETVQQFKQLKESPEYFEAMQETRVDEGYQQLQNDDMSLGEKTGAIFKEETSAAVEETVREETRKNLKKALGNAFKLF